MKKIFQWLVFCLFFLLPTGFVLAQTPNPVTIYFFWAKGCPHCSRDEVFLDRLIKKYPSVTLGKYEVSQPESIALWQKAATRLKAKIGYTPFTVIGNQYFTGYLDEQTTGEQIEKTVMRAVKTSCPDILKEETSVQPSACPSAQPTEKPLPESLNLPLIGRVKIKNLSLPLLTVIIGIVDGFNPCAMWTLLFLISLLLGMKDKKRMWLLGGTFILVSGLVYLLFMSAWLNLFIFVGFIFWVRIIIGLLALFLGGYSLRDYWVNRSGACKVVAGRKRKRVIDQIKAIVQKQQLLLALTGMVILAFAVNLVELFCSIGLPAIYTQILSINKLTSWQYFLYLLGYIFFYMFDDLIVFITAMLTLRIIDRSHRYQRFSRLVGGVIILIIGILLLFKPEWLTFG